MNTDLRTFSLFDALLQRRSRRFARGMNLEGGPLSYKSTQPPQPLTTEQEAALSFAACGVTGYALAELPYEGGSLPETGGGNIMTHFVGRTAPSGDAMHDCTVFVTNDTGTWMLRRPQDYPRSEVAALVESARRHELNSLYDKARVRLTDHRTEVPRQTAFVPPFNRWTADVAGSTYFLPVAELSALYINVLLSMFDDDFHFYLVDDHNGFQPAGVAKFARSAGGHLSDDLAEGRTLTLSMLDTWVCEFAAIEQGAILQNLGLMTAALGIGGFPHFAAHPFIWPVCLGFRTVEATPMKTPTPVGLEREGQVLIKSFAPPYYKNMEEAVRAFVDYKFAPGTGTFRDGGAATGWKDGPGVQRGMPKYKDHTVEAAVAAAEYIYQRYGRFPGGTGPFRTVLAYQAHNLDRDFYDKFYRPDAWDAGAARGQ